MDYRPRSPKRDVTAHQKGHGRIRKSVRIRKGVRLILQNQDAHPDTFSRPFSGRSLGNTGSSFYPMQSPERLSPPLADGRRSAASHAPCDVGPRFDKMAAQKLHVKDAYSKETRRWSTHSKR